MVLQPRICRNIYGLGSFHFARRYFGNRCFFLLLLLLRCFSSEGWPPIRMLGLLPNGLSHSEIFGSSLVCKSPKLIAAYHVFLRLQEPRHPPYALIYFLFFVTHTPITYTWRLSHLLNYVNELRSILFLRSMRNMRSWISRLHRACCLVWRSRAAKLIPLSKAPERRCSSRTFRYGYLVTT